MLRALRSHWPEYLSEATLLCLFMISASGFTILLKHPASPLVAVLPDPFLRRMLIGMAMGLTALTLIFSPMGKCSGAHFNPAVTLTYLRLGKVQPWDAVFYVIAQFVGGVLGVAAVAAVARPPLAHESVHFVAALPGARGAAVAFAAELVATSLLWKRRFRE